MGFSGRPVLPGVVTVVGLGVVGPWVVGLGVVGPGDVGLGVVGAGVGGLDWHYQERFTLSLEVYTIKRDLHFLNTLTILA